MFSKQQSKPTKRQAIKFDSDQSGRKVNSGVVGAGSVDIKPKASVSIGRRTAAMLVSGLIIATCLISARLIQSREAETVLIVESKGNLTPGTLVTEASVSPKEMTRADFERWGEVEVKKDGKLVKEQQYITWDKRSAVLNQFANIYIPKGTPLKTTSVVKELAVRSPWLKNVEPGMEVYTMNFSVKDIYSPIFYPGAQVRIRMVYDVPVESAAGIKSEIDKKEKLLQSGKYVATGDSIIVSALQGDTYADAGGVFGTSNTNQKTVPISEVVFDKITVVDMLNNSNESVFDLYLDLIGKPVSKRIEYVKTSIANSDTTSFRQKVTPSQLVFVVTREEANTMTIFENLNATLKYTVLPETGEDYSLMTQFTELNSQLQSFIDNAAVSSFD